MKLGGLAAAVVVVAVGAVLAGWVGGADGDRAEPVAAPSGPAQPTASDEPEGSKISAAEPGSAGLSIRYLDEDGKIRSLDVKDFRR
ncbi:MAG: hypothetical protein H0T91_03790 [Propionibacteriaceae bacterium]|nr:hypothetical protein [Propionibacteriaceae bacterium]